MARTHERSPSLDAKDSTSLMKRLKSSHLSPPTVAPGNGSDVDHCASFANDVLDHTNIAKLHAGYISSGPFKYALIEKLFQDDLLKSVKDECLSELSFTEKETDIYKVLSPSPSLLGIMARPAELC